MKFLFLGLSLFSFSLNSFANTTSTKATITCQFNSLNGMNGKESWNAGGLKFNVDLNSKNVKTECYPISDLENCVLDGPRRNLNLEAITSYDQLTPVFSTVLNKNTADRLIIFGGNGDDTHLQVVIAISQKYNAQKQSTQLAATATLTSFDIPEMTGTSNLTKCEVKIHP